MSGHSGSDPTEPEVVASDYEQLSEYKALVKSGVTTGYTDSGFNENRPYKKDPCRAYSTVVGGFLYMWFPGCLYVTGVLSTYVQSYFRIPAENTIV